MSGRRDTRGVVAGPVDSHASVRRPGCVRERADASHTLLREGDEERERACLAREHAGCCLWSSTAVMFSPFVTSSRCFFREVEGMRGMRATGRTFRWYRVLAPTTRAGPPGWAGRIRRHKVTYALRVGAIEKLIRAGLVGVPGGWREGFRRAARGNAFAFVAPRGGGAGANGLLGRGLVR